MTEAAPSVHITDDRGTAGFSWVVEEPMRRASHALASEGKVWLVDPVASAEPLQRVHTLGEPAAVIQLLDRHRRDAAEVAASLGVPHLRLPGALPGTPFEVIAVLRRRLWTEHALWWPQARTLVVAEALGTTTLFTGRRRALVRCLPTFRPELQHAITGHEVALREAELDRKRETAGRSAADLLPRAAASTRPVPGRPFRAAALGVHLLLRLTPPRRLAGFDPKHLLVGHGEGLHGDGVEDAITTALQRSRRDLPRALLALPRSG